MMAAKQRADEAGVTFTMHQSFARTDTDYDDARFGKHPLLHLGEIGALGKHCSFVHMNVIRDDELEPIIASEMNVVWHPGNFQFYNIAAASPSRMVALRERGAHVTLCTDVAKAWTFGDMGLLAYLVAREHGGFIPPESIFEMQSIGAARAVAMEDELGSIEVGKRADIVIRNRNFGEAHPDLDPIREIALIGRSKSVDTVIVDGEVVLRRGSAQRIDEQEVWRMAGASARRLVAELGLKSGPGWPVIRDHNP
jgi:5-methylthioadenosine/S-adenosylhomocysteine deaminase